MGQKIQNLQHKLGHYRSRVSSRVASTIRVIRTRSSLGRDEVEEVDPANAMARHLQLHNTIVRALLVDEVLYEPSRLLKKSRRAVAIITGADLVLVKMTKSTTTGSAAAADTVRASYTRGTGGSSDGGTAADVAQATVLAQHELNKMVHCEAKEHRLELEFIVTSSARFKVSPAALGFHSSSGSGALDGSSTAGPFIAPPTSAPAPVFVGPISTGSSSSAPIAEQLETTLQEGIPGSRVSSAGDVLQEMGAASLTAATGTGDDALLPNQQQLQEQSMSYAPRECPAHRGTSFDSADIAAASCHEQHGITPPTAASSSSSIQAAQRRSSTGTGLSYTRSGSYVRQLGSSMVQGASRSVSSSISNFRLVKTDDGDYWVSVESFTLQFRDAAMCQLAASLLMSGRSSMRIALDWLKQGLPFSSEFAITHITELSDSRTGNEVLVAGATPWGTELQLPDSWTDAIRTAQLPEEQPLMTPLEVLDGPAAFRVHLATPAGLAEATLLPEMLALLARQANPQHTAQLLAVPVSLRLIADSAEAALPDRPVQCFDLAPACAVHQQEDTQHHGSSSGNATCSSSGADDIEGIWDSNTEAEELDERLGEDEIFTEVEADDALDSEAGTDAVDDVGGDVVDDASREHSLTSSERLPAVDVAYQRNFSSSSTRGILKNTQLDSTPLQKVGSTAVDDSAAAAAVCSARHKVGWSPELADVEDLKDHALQVESNHRYAGHLAAVRIVEEQQQQQQQQQQPVHLQRQQQQQQQSQRAGLRSQAKRAAKKLLRRVVTPRTLALKAAGRASSGPPSCQDPSYSSRGLVYGRSKSNPEGLMAAAAAASVQRGSQLSRPGTGANNSGSYNSVQVHRYGSSGKLLPVHAGDAQLSAAAMQDAATGPTDGPAVAQSSTPNAPDAQQKQQYQKQQQHQLRQDSTNSAATGTWPDGVEDIALQNSRVLTRAASSRDFRIKPEDQEELKLSFMSETYAVIHVQLVPCNSSTGRNSSNGSVSSGNTLARPPAAAAAESPFAAVALMPGVNGESAPGVNGPTPSVLVLGQGSNAHRTSPAPQEQQLLSALGLLAGLLCGLGMLVLHSIAGRLLVLAAAVLNAMCMLGAAKPSFIKAAMWRHRHGSKIRTTSSLVPSQTGLHMAANTAAGGLASQSSWDLSAFHSAQAQGITAAAAATAPQRPGAAAAAGADGAADLSSGLLEGRLRLRLLGGGFMKEALGLLEEQILAYKNLKETAAAAAAAAAAQGLSVANKSSGSDEAAGLPAAQHAMVPCDSTDALVLVSTPEPDWMTPDWRKRIMVSRPNNEERCKVAGLVHTFRSTYKADQMLKRMPANFDFFHANLALKPLLVTPQGYVVLLLKMQTLVQISRIVAAASLSMNDMVAYCGFLWSFMFEVLAPHSYPAGRVIMVVDMSNIKLGQAVGEGQVGARALGEVCFAWPERLCRCLVLGTPSWFNMLYRMVRPHLSPNTRAKVQICDSSEGAAELARCLGPELVPKEWGGPCTLSYDDYPAQKQLLQLVEHLQRQQ